MKVQNILYLKRLKSKLIESRQFNIVLGQKIAQTPKQISGLIFSYQFPVRFNFQYIKFYSHINKYLQSASPCGPVLPYEAVPLKQKTHYERPALHGTSRLGTVRHSTTWINTARCRQKPICSANISLNRKFFFSVIVKSSSEKELII